ncbi:MAG: sugar transferase [Flavobacteriaceae bacterium]|nr:sugar transferase [Flavobacteriaceae bacterium]
MYPLLKRGADILFSIIGILISAPLILISVFLIFLSGETSPFYLSHRIGQGGKLFRMFKLRTMNRSKPSKSPLTGFNDNRVNFFGRFLRFSKIDELPQFFNILNGDLSFVGPRPLLPEVFMYYPKEVRQTLNTVRPGVTGIGSIVFRNESDLFKKAKGSNEDFYKHRIAPLKADLELWYVKKYSFVVDFKILIYTVVAVFYGQVKSIEKRFKNLPSIEILNHRFD